MFCAWLCQYKLGHHRSQSGYFLAWSQECLHLFPGFIYFWAPTGEGIDGIARLAMVLPAIGQARISTITYNWFVIYIYIYMCYYHYMNINNDIDSEVPHSPTPIGPDDMAE